MALTHKTIPTSPGFQAVDFRLVGRSQTFASPLTGAAQVNLLSGARWRARYEIPVAAGDDALAWRAFLASLRGRAFAFYGHDPAFRSYKGLAAFTVDAGAPTFDSTSAFTFDATGTPTFDAWAGPLTVGSPYVRLGGQTGAVLKTGGWTPKLRLYAGEYIAFDYADANGNSLRALHMIAVSINVGAGGEVNLTLDPPVRVAPANGATILTDSPGCSMRLVADDGGGWSVDAALHHRIAFEAEQVILAEASA